MMLSLIRNEHTKYIRRTTNDTRKRVPVPAASINLRGSCIITNRYSEISYNGWRHTTKNIRVLHYNFFYFYQWDTFFYFSWLAGCVCSPWSHHKFLSRYHIWYQCFNLRSIFVHKIYISNSCYNKMLTLLSRKNGCIFLFFCRNLSSINFYLTHIYSSKQVFLQFVYLWAKMDIDMSFYIIVKNLKSILGFLLYLTPYIWGEHWHLLPLMTVNMEEKIEDKQEIEPHISCKVKSKKLRENGPFHHKPQEYQKFTL